MTAFVLGNGISRLAVNIDTLMKLGSVYGCNALYRTHTPRALIATDQPIARIIQESGYSLKNRFYTRRPLPDTGALDVPKKYFGFSSGPIAAAVAAQDHNNPIYLVGFDMAPDTRGKFNNVYASTDCYKAAGAAPTYTGNWIRQLITVMQDHRDQQFIRVMGETTAQIDDFFTAKNYETLPMTEFLRRINTQKDL